VSTIVLGEEERSSIFLELMESAEEESRFKELTETRLSTGVPGLDTLIDGGLRKNSVVCLAGPSGTGKSTFAIQFLLDGLFSGNNAFFISMEESWDQIVRDYKPMGWTALEDFYEKGQLKYIKFEGEQFKDFIEEKIPSIVKGAFFKERDVRIVIDPLTPLLWAYDDRNTLRSLLSRFWNLIRHIGTCVCTVEQHFGSQTYGDYNVSIPIFLSDGVIKLDNLGVGGEFNYTLKIIKMRGTKITDLDVVGYKIVPGIGAYIIPPEESERDETNVNWRDSFSHVETIIEEKVKGPLREYLLNRIKVLKIKSDSVTDIDEVLNQFVLHYKLGEK
jgi:KaiC/GvpD/RAD55 family RecA-like ATPase